MRHIREQGYPGDHHHRQDNLPLHRPADLHDRGLLADRASPLEDPHPGPQRAHAGLPDQPAPAFLRRDPRGAAEIPEESREDVSHGGRHFCHLLFPGAFALTLKVYHHDTVEQVDKLHDFNRARPLLLQ